MESTALMDPVMVEMKDGHAVDLGPLVRAAEEVDRHREASPVGVTALLLGMRIAVGKLCGSTAAELFDARVVGEE